jgi:hypothetical protein
LLWLFFGDGGVQNYLPDWPRTKILPISASEVVRIIAMGHQHPAPRFFFEVRSC